MRTVWVVGARGLLGSAVVRSIDASAGWSRLDVDPLPWADEVEFPRAVVAGFQVLSREARLSGSPWSIVWTAGAAFTSSTQEELDQELDQFRLFLTVVQAELELNPCTGSIFLASSGGGLYAGAANPPFTEDTPVAPLAPYGWFKLAMENELKRFAAEAKVSVLLGRVTNLYGPGQRIDKLQGLITHLAIARYGTKPAFIFVPLGTVRDYIYVDDCAALILDSLERLIVESIKSSFPLIITKILGSGQAISISTLLGYYRGITKAAPRVIHGTTDASKHQAFDLSMRSIVWPDIDRRDKMPVAAGFKATMLDVLRVLQH